MLRAFLSELIKLKRWSVASAFISMLVITGLGIALSLHRVSTEHGLNSFAQRLALEGPGGIGVLEVHLSDIFGAIALVTVGANVASEWGLGTLRNLLVREPRRIHLLTGKMLALLLYLIASVIVSLAVGWIEADLVAPHDGIVNAQWTTSQGFVDWLSFVGDALIGFAGWCFLGLIFAVWTRSVAAAIGASIVYGLAVEILVEEVLPGFAQWLPVHSFDYVSEGGTAAVSFSTAATMTGIYIVVFAAISAALFAYRDVTA